MRERSVPGASARRRRLSRRQREAAARAKAVAEAEQAAERLFERYQAAESELLALLGAGANAPRVRAVKARVALLAREVVAARAAIRDAKAGTPPAADGGAATSLGVELAAASLQIESSDDRRAG